MNWATRMIASLMTFLKVQVASLRELLAIGREGSAADDEAGKAVAAEMRSVRLSIAAEKTLVRSGPPREVIDLQAPDHWPLPRPGGKRGRYRTSVDNKVLVPSTQRTIPVVRADGKPPWAAAEYPLEAEPEPASETPPGPVPPDPEPEPEPEPPAEEPAEENPWPSGRGLTGQFRAVDDYIDRLPNLGDPEHTD